MPAARSPVVMAGALCWLIQPVYLLVELLTVARVSAPYSVRDNTISDAAAATCTTVPYAWGEVPVCSPLSPLLNATTALSGIALAAGAVLLRSRLTRVRGAILAVAVLSGLSLIATGFVPLDVDLDLHLLVALPQFVTFPLLLILLTVAVRARSRAVALCTAVAAVVCVVGVLGFLVRIGEPHWGGLLERAALWPVYLAVVPVAAVLVGPSSAHARARSSNRSASRDSGATTPGTAAGSRSLPRS
ncbi:DUF998 domain-containing protein [Nocardia farcinica]|uniref:DUF998 domain-containing protein n=1 Tax=Nocardia farcinica TaxID=37329 RepID=UPI002455ADDE|nr:DUF998 domain-containing protein [Nocardia farcinica]